MKIEISDYASVHEYIETEIRRAYNLPMLQKHLKHCNEVLRLYSESGSVEVEVRIR